MMQAQIVRDSEVHRQHLRLKIPIQVEVDGVRYKVDDWSSGGFGVESVMTSRQAGECFPVKVIFPFADFEMSMRFDARMVYRDQDHGRFGCAFLGMSQAQSEVFRYLIDAYLSGEVVRAGDLLQLRPHDGAARAHFEEADVPEADVPEADVPEADVPEVEPELPRGRLRRNVASIAFGLAGLGLLIVVGWGFGARYLRGASVSAVVEAPIIQVRAPIAGRLATTVAAGARVPKGTSLGSLTGFDGTSVALGSPCDCVVVQQSGLDGQPYPVGAPLFALVHADQPLLIQARLPLAATERLQAGDRVEIRVPGQSGVRYGQIERIDLRVPIEALTGPGPETPPAGRLAEVLVRPDRPFALDDFGTLVTVRFP
jgi:alginate biosynthesis protein Alg44